MKIYRVLWLIPGQANQLNKNAFVFWNTEAEANMHVENLVKAYTTLGFPAPASYVTKHSVYPGERFFE